ncbi:hypothetical protein QTP88_027690 [Uroleucon formosanum]
MSSSLGGGNNVSPDRKNISLKVSTTRKQPVLHEFSIYSKKGKSNKSNLNDSNPISPNFKSIRDNPPQLTIPNVRHISSNNSTEFNFDTDVSPMSTDNVAIDNNSIVDMHLNHNDNNQTTSDDHGNDSSGNAIENIPIIVANLLSFSDSYLGPLYVTIDTIDKNLHLGKLHPMKIGKLIHGKVTGVTEIKSLGARVRLTFDNVTNANTCLSKNPLKSYGFTATIPSTLVYSLGVIRLDQSISESDFFDDSATQEDFAVANLGVHIVLKPITISYRISRLPLQIQPASIARVVTLHQTETAKSGLNRRKSRKSWLSKIYLF